jgi:glycosyltransferase involved in cell wall biosynthesis
MKFYQGRKLYLKKILFVYPHNFLDKDMGTNIRVYQLAKYLSDRGYSIDLYACKNMASTSFDRFAELNRENIINTLYLYDFEATRRFKKHKLSLYKLRRVFDRRKKLDDWVTPIMQRQFFDILQNGYDFVVMFYLYTGELLKETGSLFKKIYFMEDFLSVNQYISNCCKELGGGLNSEIERLRYFDEIACISSDEKIFFEKVVPDKKYYFIPHLVQAKKLSPGDKAYDILFIGADNNYNSAGIHWFLTNIYPYLNGNIKILIAGKIVAAIQGEYRNITRIGYVQNLTDLYSQIKISICPLLNGTGMKIKVIEAMSYGIPVVCTARGVDGFPDKNENGCLVADDPLKFANYINRLLQDEEFYRDISVKERNYFATYLSMERSRVLLDQIFS